MNNKNKEPIVFRKTKDEYGYLSNMCGGYPITVNGITFKTSEALYQSLKFTDSKIQEEIINAKSPMTAKMISRKYTDEKKEFEGCEYILVDIMRFCLLEKFNQNESIKEKLISTFPRQIIEYDKDDSSFWGMNTYTGKGRNELGKLLMDVRSIIMGNPVILGVKENVINLSLMNEVVELNVYL